MKSLLDYRSCITSIKEFFEVEELKWTSLILILDTVLKTVEYSSVDIKLMRKIVWYALNMAYVPHVQYGVISAKFNRIYNESYIELVAGYPIDKLIAECPSFKDDLRNFYNFETEKLINSCINISKEVLLNSVLRIIVIKALLLIDPSPIYMLDLGFSQNNNMSNYEIIASMLGYEFIGCIYFAEMTCLVD